MEKVIKLQTVNVVEYLENAAKSVNSFSDDEEGNKEAETLFAQIAKENEFTDEEIEDGYVSARNNDYQVFLIHS
jgi:hypothetical protein